MSLGRSMAWMGAAQILSVLIQFSAQVFLLRHLTLHEAGIYGVGVAIVALLAIVQELGLKSFIIRESEMGRPLQASTFTINAILSILLAALIFGGSLYGGTFFGEPAVRKVLMVLAVTPIINIFAFLPSAMLEREGRFKEIAQSTMAGSLAAAITTVALTLLGYRYMSAAYAQWANALVVALLSMAMMPSCARPLLGLHQWRRVADFALQMFTVNGVSILCTRLSDPILGRTLGLSALGLFGRASSLTALLWTNVHLLFGRVMLVDFVEIHQRGESLRARYIATADIVTVLLWPMFAGFAVVAGPFILQIYGERWLPATLPLALIAAAYMILAMITMTFELFTATGAIRLQTRLEVTRSVIALSSFVAGCMISLEAAAAARIFEALCAVALYRPHLNRITDTRMSDFIPIFSRNLGLTLVAVGPAVLCMSLYRWDAHVPLPWLGLSVAAGILLWMAALFASGHGVAQQARAIVTRRRTAGQATS